MPLLLLTPGCKPRGWSVLDWGLTLPVQNHIRCLLLQFPG